MDGDDPVDFCMRFECKRLFRLPDCDGSRCLHEETRKTHIHIVASLPQGEAWVVMIPKVRPGAPQPVAEQSGATE